MDRRFQAARQAMGSSQSQNAIPIELETAFQEQLTTLDDQIRTLAQQITTMTIQNNPTRYPNHSQTQSHQPTSSASPPPSQSHSTFQPSSSSSSSSSDALRHLSRPISLQPPPFSFAASLNSLPTSQSNSRSASPRAGASSLTLNTRVTQSKAFPFSSNYDTSASLSPSALVSAVSSPRSKSPPIVFRQNQMPNHSQFDQSAHFALSSSSSSLPRLHSELDSSSVHSISAYLRSFLPPLSLSSSSSLLDPDLLTSFESSLSTESRSLFLLSPSPNHHITSIFSSFRS